MASPTARAKYPRQIIALVEDEVADRIDSIAVAQGLSKSEVVRTLIDAALVEMDSVDE